jgi:hypothetical protein
MKTTLVVLVVAALALPATALAKGPSSARIDGPGLGKAITITGPEQEGSPLMDFAEQTGFFPAAFGQEPDPMLPERPNGNLGPKYSIDYKVPGPEGKSFEINQDLYPYAKPYALTYTASGQAIFDMTTKGGWYQSPLLKQTLVSAGLPAEPKSTASSTSSSFFSTGRLGSLAGGAALQIAFGSVLARRRRGRPGTTA